MSYELWVVSYRNGLTFDFMSFDFMTFEIFYMSLNALYGEN